MKVDEEEGFRAAYVEPPDVGRGLVAPMIRFRMCEMAHASRAAEFDAPTLHPKTAAAASGVRQYSAADAYAVSAARFRYFRPPTATRAGIQRCRLEPRGVVPV